VAVCYSSTGKKKKKEKVKKEKERKRKRLFLLFGKERKSSKVPVINIK